MGTLSPVLGKHDQRAKVLTERPHEPRVVDVLFNGGLVSCVEHHARWGAPFDEALVHAIPLRERPVSSWRVALQRRYRRPCRRARAARESEASSVESSQRTRGREIGHVPRVREQRVHSAMDGKGVHKQEVGCAADLVEVIERLGDVTPAAVGDVGPGRSVQSRPRRVHKRGVGQWVMLRNPPRVPAPRRARSVGNASCGRAPQQSKEGTQQSGGRGRGFHGGKSSKLSQK